MAKLKLFVVLFVVILQIEFIASSNKINPFILKENTITNGTVTPCTDVGSLLQCDFSTPHGQKYQQGITLSGGNSVNLTIIGAPVVFFDEQYSGSFKNIRLFQSEDITVIKGIPRASSYSLLLENSNGKLINDDSISYFKAENSSIIDLRLESVDEFDIATSNIGTFYANAKESMRSTIIGSHVSSLSLTIAEQSWLYISNTKIDTIEKMIIKNTSHIIATTINKIPSNAITIIKGFVFTLEDVVLGHLASKGISVHGTLQLVNVKYLKGYPLDWVALKPGGALTITKFFEGKDSTMQNYTITNGDFELNPFEIIEVPKRVWLVIMLGVFLLITVLCLVFLWFCKFSGKKFHVRKINVEQKIDKKEFSKLEEKDPVRDALKNVYEIDNHEFPTPPKTVVNNSDPECQQEYVDCDDLDNMVNYTELDENNTNSADACSDIKINIGGKAPNNEMANKPIIPPGVPAPLPSQKAYKPKPIGPKPSNACGKIPNKSFLQTINPKLIPVPPPPSKTGPVAIENFRIPPIKMLPPTPIRKYSRDDCEPYESQEEYDVCEDSDG